MNEKQMKGIGIEMIDCFFCGEPNSCKFVDGKGFVALGEKKNRTEFGSHAMCKKCRKPTKTKV